VLEKSHKTRQDTTEPYIYQRVRLDRKGCAAFLLLHTS